MNKHLYRVVFNRARALLMAVQESAASSGKSASGEGGSVRRPVLASGLFLALLSWGPGQAQIVADPGAPGGQRPTVLTAPNGVPLVNIQTPSAAGVSRNTYGQFDVNRPGAILNNSRVSAQTQLGGWVQGNPWLAKGSARVILNEVNSSNPSYLRGPVEVAGQRAEVIIANPAGIQIDGAGFINASRVTLTTGTAVMNGGSLESFRVREGTVSVEGLGLDTRSADYTTILARATQVNAGIWAQELKVAVGAHDASADGAVVTPATGSGPRPAFALDVAALGGMYAGKIWLIGTEAGLGVNSAGTIASEGSLHLDADGNLTNTGTMRSAGATEIAAKGLSNSGTIAAASSLRMATEGTLDNRGGTLEAAQLLLASSQGDIDNRGGTLRQTGPAALALAAPSLSNTSGGFIGYEPLAAITTASPAVASGTAAIPSPATPAAAAAAAADNDPATPAPSTGAVGTVTPSPPGSIGAAGTLRNDGGRIYAGSPIQLATPEVDNSGGTLQAQSLTVSGPTFRNTGGTLVLSQGFSAQVGQFDNSGGTLRAGSLSIASAGDILNREGTLVAQEGSAALQAGGALDNSGGRIQAGGALDTRSGQATTNTGGVMAADAGVSITAGSLANTGGAIASTLGSVAVTATSAIDNTAGHIGAAQDLVLQAADLHNGGVLRAERDLDATVSDALTDSDRGSISAAGDTRLKAGSISTAGALAAGVKPDGTLGDSGALSVQARGAITAGGAHLAAGTLTLEGASLDLSGSQNRAAAISANAHQGSLDTRGAQLNTKGTLDLRAAGDVQNQGGTLVGGQVLLQARDFDNADGGRIQATDGLRAGVSGAFVNDGGTVSASHIQVQAGGTITNTAGVIRQASTDPQAALTLSAAALDGAKGQILVDGALHAQVAGAWMQDGGVTSAAALQLDAGRLSNRAGQLQQTGTGAGRITVAAGLDNTQGTIASNGLLDVAAASVVNSGGHLQTAAGADLALRIAGVVDNRADGHITAGGDAAIAAASLANTGGTLTAAGRLAADIAGQLDNTAGLVASNGDGRLVTGALVNDRGTLASVEGGLQVSSTAVASNLSGKLQAAGALGFGSAGLDNRQGRLVAGSVDLDTGTAALDNRGGTIASTDPAGQLRIGSGALVNDAGLVQAAGDLVIDTHGQTLSNRDAAAHAASVAGGIAAAGQLELHAGPLDNTAGAITVGGPASLALAAGADGTALRNTVGGQILGRSGVSIRTESGTLDNRGGQMQVAADLQLSAGTGTIDNSAGLLRSAARLSATAASLVNHATQGRDQGIEGLEVALDAAAVDNTQGAIRADRDIAITASRLLDNSAGLVSAGKALSIVDPQATSSPAAALQIRNTAGQLQAGGALTIAAATVAGSGQAQSGADMAISTSQDTVHDGQWTSAGDLTWASTATLQNRGLLHAANTLGVAARTIVNEAGAELGSDDTTVVHASDTLANRGLIDGHTTRIDAGTLDNTGAGRIYGDQLSIAANLLRNVGTDIGAGGTAPTIAARERLDIGAVTVLNQDGGLLFSLGDMAIGGALDAARRATGKAGDITNASAKIEALGSLWLTAAKVQNLELHLQTATQTVAGGHEQVIVLDGDTQRRPASDFIQLTGYLYRKIHPELYGTEPSWDPAIRYPTCSADCTELPTFEPADSPRFVALGIAPPPPGMGPYDEDGHISEPWTQLQTAIALHNGLVASNDELSAGYAGWTVYDSTTTTSHDTVTASAPARISAGGDITISGPLVNRDSQVVAGGTIATDQAPQNLQSTGTEIQHTEGTAEHWHRVKHTFQSANAHSDGIQPYQPADSVTTYPLTSGLAYEQHTSSAGSGAAVGTGTRGVVTTPVMTVVAATTGIPALASPLLADISAAMRDATVDRVDRIDTQHLDTDLQPTAPPSPPVAAPAPAPAPGGGDAAFVRVATAPRTLPSASLFTLTPASSVSHLVETDPRFTDHRQWLSSDYLLGALGLDPALAQKRLGDGFYEQQILREQVAQLTGRRYLDGFASDQAEFQALMDAGITAAHRMQLAPGIALSPAQVAQLTSDIVWMVSQTFTLPDGSTQQVLVPQLYARVQAGDLDGSGALLSGERVVVDAAPRSGDLVNSGTIAGRSIVALTADNLRNLGGRITGDVVSATARQDLSNIGGQIDAGSLVVLDAGRNVDIASTTSTQTSAQGSRTNLDRVAALYVGNPGGTLVVSAGQDVNIVGAILANAGNATQVHAGKDLNLGTVVTSVSESVAWNPQNHRNEAASAEVGSSISTAGGTTLLQAGQDINARQAVVDGGTGTLALQAGRDIAVQAGTSRSSSDQAFHSEDRGLLSSTSSSRHDSVDTTSAEASSLGGANVVLSAGRDIAIVASQVVSDQGTMISAGRDVAITAQAQTATEAHGRSESQSGLMGSGGIGVTYGQRSQNSDTTSIGTTAAGSTVGSVNGGVTIVAGNQYRQVGSDVVAPNGDIAIQARDVQIVEARETSQVHSEQHTRQSGLTLAVTAPVISAIQSAAATAAAAGQTQSGRMQALGAASVAMSAATAAQSLQAMNGATGATEAAKAGGVGISLSLGASQSDSRTEQASDSARGSTVQGRNVSIVATGGAQASNILIRGSDIGATDHIGLSADNRVDILAAQNTASQHSENSSSSASVGMAMQVGQGSGGIGFTAAASVARGHADGEDVIQSNSHISAGQQVSIHSGGDTNIVGGVVSAQQVVAEVGGNLTIQSLQDTSRYQARQQSVGGSVMIGAGGGSLSVSSSRTHADYASVSEQSGIQAGDGGFQVKVGGNTNLVGGAIASTQAAVDAGVNRFDTRSLTTSDIENHADYSASGFSLSGSYTPAGTGKASDGSKQGATPNAAGGINGGAAGIGSASGHANSTTASGISGIAGNTEVRTGDSSKGLVKTFDADKVAKEISAQVQITSTFGQQASRAIGDYAESQMRTAHQLRALAEQNPDESDTLNAQAQALESNWGETGTLRILAHTVVGGLTGGASGAAGSALGTITAPVVAHQLEEAGITGPLAQSLIAAASAAAGAVVGSVAGTATALNEVANNYLSHIEDKALKEARLGCKSGKQPQACAEQTRLENLDKERDDFIKPLVEICKAGATEANCDAVARHYAEVNGYGHASAHYESANHSGSPFSQNGKLVGEGDDAHYQAPQIKQKDGTYKEDPGGMSYGLFQLSSKKGGLQDFMNYLQTKASGPEGLAFYDALQEAGGIEAAKAGQPAFMEKFMELTTNDPQFVEYQFESLRQGPNLKNATKDFVVASLQFEDAGKQIKDAVFSTSVQHGGGGADKAVDHAFSSKTYTKEENDFSNKQSEYESVVQDRSKLEQEGRRLEAEGKRLEKQKIETMEKMSNLDKGDTPSALEQANAIAQLNAKLLRLNQKIYLQDEKIGVNAQKIEVNQTQADELADWLAKRAAQALSNPKQFIQDIYDWRIKMNPAEAGTRYIPERDRLINELEHTKKKDK